jgi:hypothetical protein
MHKITTDNPYTPSSNIIYAPPLDASWAAYLGRIFWFLPGTIVGLYFGRCFQTGIASTFSSVRSMTAYSGVYLLIFSCSCFLLTLLWRLPRRYFAGGAQVSSSAAFSSGMFMTLSATLVVSFGVESGLVPMKQWAHIGILVLSGFVAVEFESILSHSFSKRGQV